MKLIDLLVQELPKRGGWPDGVARLAQDPDGDIQLLSDKNAFYCNVGWTGDARRDYFAEYIRDFDVIAEDQSTTIVTREQYEVAIRTEIDEMVELSGISVGAAKIPYDAGYRK